VPIRVLWANGKEVSSRNLSGPDSFKGFRLGPRMRRDSKKKFQKGGTLHFQGLNATKKKRRDGIHIVMGSEGGSRDLIRDKSGRPRSSSTQKPKKKKKRYTTKTRTPISCKPRISVMNKAIPYLQVEMFGFKIQESGFFLVPDIPPQGKHSRAEIVGPSISAVEVKGVLSRGEILR